jgi:intracellular septation protein A
MDPAAPPSPPASARAPGAPPRENLWANLICNLALPSLLMTKGPGWLGLSPVAALLVALAFPLGYGVYDLLRRRTWNIFSIIGLAALLLTGGIGLFKLPTAWVALKDAALPLGLGVIVVASLRSKQPLVQTLLLNPTVIDVARVEAALAGRQTQAAFRGQLRRATWLVAVSCVVHGALNYVLVRHLVHAPAGSPEFTAEMGRLTLWMWPLAIVPSSAILLAAVFYLLHGLTHLTGLKFEEMFHAELLEPKEK